MFLHIIILFFLLWGMPSRDYGSVVVDRIEVQRFQEKSNTIVYHCLYNE